MEHRVVVLTDQKKNEYSKLQLAFIQYKRGENKTLEMVIEEMDAKIKALENENTDLKQEIKSLKAQDKNLSDSLIGLTTTQAQLRTMIQEDISNLTTRIANMEEK